MTISSKNRFKFDIQNCCVCGLRNCQQSIDHQRVIISQLRQIILFQKLDVPSIDKLKNQTKTQFNILRTHFLAMLKEKQKQIIRTLNSFYFKHLQGLSKNTSIFSDILQNDFSNLPQKNITKTFKTISKLTHKRCNQKLHTQWITDQLNQVFKKMELSNTVQKIKKQINTDYLKKKFNIHQLSKSIKSTKSDTSTLASSQKKLQLALETYEWKYVRFTKNTKTVELNNRNITDQDMIKQLPIISTFTNIKQFQIRNNKITALTCNIIANDMKFLSVLDLRGNKVGDTGISKLVIGIPSLKSLFISETGISDQTGLLISEHLQQLQTLWSEHTNLTGQICLKISSKPKLRLLSLLGNPIDQDFKQRIIVNFRVKGYLNI